MRITLKRFKQRRKRSLKSYFNSSLTRRLTKKLYDAGYEHKEVKAIWAYAWNERDRSLIFDFFIRMLI
jgi:hypothetical protein